MLPVKARLKFVPEPRFVPVMIVHRSLLLQKALAELIFEPKFTEKVDPVTASTPLFRTDATVKFVPPSALVLVL